jgi:putative flavoprotein involved in K+ transport
MSTETVEVAVVGGGQAGLAMSWYLRHHGVDHVVLDAAAEVGAAWRSRWESLRLFTPARHDGLPGLPFPGNGDRYPGKDEVADYLRTYAADLPVRLNTRVRRLSRDGEGYVLDTSRGGIRADQVVVATGPFQTPRRPAFVTRLDAAVTQQHSHGYRRPDALPPGPVLVVGDGNSGRQIAAELAATRLVDLATAGGATVVPQRLLGQDLFWWLTRLGLLTTPGTSRIGRRMRDRGELVVGSPDRALRSAGVRLRPRLVGADGRRFRFTDGSDLVVDTVVWATGYQPDHSFLDVPEVLDGGRLVHDRGVTPAPGLYVLGLPWLSSRGSALLGFVGRDAVRLADRIVATRRIRRCDPGDRTLEPHP